MSPQIEFLRSRFTLSAAGGAQHRDQRGEFLLGRLALDDLDIVDRCRRRRIDRQSRGSLTSVMSVSWFMAVGSLSATSLRELRSAAHSGMFPCFFGGV